jgi:glyoxylase-like metal-dependent hydrolase (beta-lactamase superfamily II)
MELDLAVDLPICVTCGVQYGAPRDDCPVCEDERQYVGWDGQRWTSLARLAADGFRGRVEAEGPDVYGIASEPKISIGQRALLVQAPGGNILWDCVPFLDEALVAEVAALGGVSAIAVSHPHFYGSMVDWSRAFGGVPVYVHEADEQWLGRTDDVVELWRGDTLEIGDGLTLVNGGVHFDGGTVLHWAGGEDGQGALFSGDILQVVLDRRWVSFMYSYPNYIPERPETVRRAVRLLEPFAFEAIYGAFWQTVVRSDGHAAMHRSAERYLHFVADPNSLASAPPPHHH